MSTERERFEKARAWRDEFVGVYQPHEDTETTAQELDGYLAKFADRAVQDAVSEIAKGLEARAKAIELSAKPNPFADLEFHAAAAALREKYGVKPNG